MSGAHDDAGADGEGAMMRGGPSSQTITRMGVPAPAAVTMKVLQEQAAAKSAVEVSYSRCLPDIHTVSIPFLSASLARGLPLTACHCLRLQRVLSRYMSSTDNHTGDVSLTVILSPSRSRCLSCSLSLSHCLTLPLSASPLTVSLSHCLRLAVSLPATDCLCLTACLPLTVCVSLSHCLPLTHCLCLTACHSLTACVSLPACHSLTACRVDRCTNWWSRLGVKVSHQTHASESRTKLQRLKTCR